MKGVIVKLALVIFLAAVFGGQLHARAATLPKHKIHDQSQIAKHAISDNWVKRLPNIRAEMIRAQKQHAQEAAR